MGVLKLAPAQRPVFAQVLLFLVLSVLGVLAARAVSRRIARRIAPPSASCSSARVRAPSCSSARSAPARASACGLSGSSPRTAPQRRCPGSASRTWAGRTRCGRCAWRTTSTACSSRPRARRGAPDRLHPRGEPRAPESRAAIGGRRARSLDGDRRPGRGDGARLNPPRLSRSSWLLKRTLDVSCPPSRSSRSPCCPSSRSASSSTRPGRCSSRRTGGGGATGRSVSSSCARWSPTPRRRRRRCSAARTRRGCCSTTTPASRAWGTSCAGPASTSCRSCGTCSAAR